MLQRAVSGHLIHDWKVSEMDPRYLVCKGSIARGKYGTQPCPARSLNPHRPPAPRPVPTEPSGYKATSFNAYAEALPKMNDVQTRILALYHEHGAMTDEELFDRYHAAHGGYRNTVLPARNALYKAELVVATMNRRKVRSGRTAIVWSAK